MKRIKIGAVLLAVVCLLASLSFAVQAEEEPWVTLDRVVQVNKNQIICEFSEPIAINITQEKGPFVAIRVVKAGGGGLRRTETNARMEWQFSIQYLDAKHDRLLCTMSTVALNLDDITDIINWRGALAPYKDTGVEVRFIIEELPDDTTNYSDCGVCNITSVDGTKVLLPTYTSGYEAAQEFIEVDLNYEFDTSMVSSVVQNSGLDADTIVAMKGSEYLAMQGEQGGAEAPPVTTVEVVKNDPLVVALVLGGGVVIGGAVLAVALIVTRKRKVAK
jgi:hypothetical protein